MDIYTYLAKDHKKVSALFKKIILAKTPKERESFFLAVKKELILHADSEHQTFYAALRKDSTGKEDAEHGDKEHDEIKKALAKLSKIPAKETSKWLVQFGELKHMVEHHVRDEETKMFKDAKSSITSKEALQLAADMNNIKNKMMESKKFLAQNKLLLKIKPNSVRSKTVKK
jgi:hemerythrin superfamily protein